MKKRSLFVATAMLLVAVLVATGATYAWFNSSTSANANITLDVSDAASIEISGDGDIWKTALTEDDLTIAGDGIWTDLSTTDTQFASANFFSETYDDAGVLVDTAYTDANLKVAAAKIYFRSTEAGDITMSNGSLKAGLNTVTDSANLIKALRVGINDDATTAASQIFATTAAVNDKAIAAADGTKGNQTTKAVNAATVIVDMTDTADANGYYTGSAIFYFWVEGSDAACVNPNTDADMVAAFSATFAQ